MIKILINKLVFSIEFMVGVTLAEQGAHLIGKSLIYSMRKAFLEKAVVELIYKFHEKSYRECLTIESIAKV